MSRLNNFLNNETWWNMNPRREEEAPKPVMPPVQTPTMKDGMYVQPQAQSTVSQNINPTTGETPVVNKAKSTDDGGTNTAKDIMGDYGLMNFLGDFMPTLVTSGMGYLTGQNEQNFSNEQLQMRFENEQKLQEADIAARLEMAGMSAEAALGAAAIAAEAQNKATLQRAYDSAIQGSLGSATGKQNALNAFLAGVQNPYLRR